MAEGTAGDTHQLFQRLKKEAKCLLCSKTVDRPKVLPCFHSFCLDCLNREAFSGEENGKTTILCCVCASPVLIPEGGKFDDFPSPFHLCRLVDILLLENGNRHNEICGNCEVNTALERYCVECKFFYCADCLIPHKQFKFTRCHATVSIRELETGNFKDLFPEPIMCEQKRPEHGEAEFYCKDCQISLCKSCLYETHRHHNMVEIELAVEEGKRLIQEGVQKLKNRASEIEERMKKDSEDVGKALQRIHAIREAVRRNVQQAILQLEQHEQQVLAKLDNIGNQQQSAFNMFVERHESRTELLRGLVEYSERAVEGSNPEALSSQHAFLGECREALSGDEGDTFNPPHVNYVVDENIEEMFRKTVLGKLVVCFTDPSKCSVEGNGLVKAKTKKQANFTVITRDSVGTACYCATDRVEVTVCSPSDEQLEVKIANQSDGRYIVTYTPLCSGQYKVAVRVNGESLGGSPWSVQVKAPKKRKK